LLCAADSLPFRLNLMPFYPVLFFGPSSAQQFRPDFPAAGDGHGTAEWVGNGGTGIDAEQVKRGGQDVLWRDGRLPPPPSLSVLPTALPRGTPAPAKALEYARNQ
jgi:hypothetical protein